MNFLRRVLQIEKKCLYLHPRLTQTSAPGAVVQLVRMPACHAGGRGFESLPHRLKVPLRYLGGTFIF